jgi:nucleotide-binding universal stress UspA family protein
MFDPDRILHPTDFSASAEAAFRHALALARQHDAELHLLHVEPSLGDDPLRDAYALGISESEFYVRVSARIAEQMDALVAAHDLEGVTLVRASARGLAPGPEIVQYADEHDVDLIALGTHGRRGVMRFLMGSVAEEVVRRASCDVLTIRAEGADEAEALTPEAVTRVVAPLDLSAYSLPLARRAAALASDYTASLTLLHVVEPLPTPVPFMGAVTLHDIVGDPVGQADDLLNRLVDELGPDVPATEARAVEGHAALTITETAEEAGADLIVIASHGLTGLERVLLGSVTARVVRRAPCPVYVARVEPESWPDDIIMK